MFKGRINWRRRQNCRHQSFNLPNNKILAMVFMPLLPKSGPLGLQPWGKHFTSILRFWFISQSLLVCAQWCRNSFPLMTDMLLALLSFIFSWASLMFSSSQLLQEPTDADLCCGECAQVIRRFELLSSYQPPWDLDYNLHSHCEG